MKYAWSTLLVTLGLLASGGALFFHLTQGLAAFTSETARQIDIRVHPVSVPPIMAYDQSGNVLRINEDPSGLGRMAIVDFIYTRCTSICSALGASYQQLQTQIVAAHLEQRVRLVTISFDPAHDDPAAMSAYAKRMHADPAVWTVLTVTHPSQLPNLLQAFGVVVVPAPLEEFQHNAAFHLVDERGNLVRILDIAQPAAALAEAQQLAISARPRT